jgi:hypothetical protein
MITLTGFKYDFSNKPFSVKNDNGVITFKNLNINNIKNIKMSHKNQGGMLPGSFDYNFDAKKV